MRSLGCCCCCPRSSGRCYPATSLYQVLSAGTTTLYSCLYGVHAWRARWHEAQREPSSSVSSFFCISKHLTRHSLRLSVQRVVGTTKLAWPFVSCAPVPCLHCLMLARFAPAQALALANCIYLNDVEEHCGSPAIQVSIAMSKVWCEPCVCPLPD